MVQSTNRSPAGGGTGGGGGVTDFLFNANAVTGDTTLATVNTMVLSASCDGGPANNIQLQSTDSVGVQIVTVTRSPGGTDGDFTLVGAPILGIGVDIDAATEGDTGHFDLSYYNANTNQAAQVVSLPGR